jgi:hypothetical protein
LNLDIWRRNPNVSRYEYLYKPRGNARCKQNVILKAFEIIKTRLEKLKSSQIEILIGEL